MNNKYLSEQIIEFTKNAIRDSGKSFDKIPQDSIIKFLAKNGVDRPSTRLEIYKQLQSIYSNESKKATISEVKEVVRPGKEARRSIFGEIKRII